MPTRLIGKSDRTIDVRGMLPADEWAAAPDFLRRQILEFAAQRIKQEKIVQLANGIGADGKRLARVQPKSRRDRSTGPALSPHRAASRSQKWCRAVIGYKAGTVVVTWSNGWLAILAYHAEGRVIGTYIRNILEFHAAATRRIESAITGQWDRIARANYPLFRWRSVPSSTPPREPPVVPIQAPPPVRRQPPLRIPDAARPGLRVRP
jgi:hypothetical protein